MTTISALPDHLQVRLRSELKPGELLTWVGQPNPNRYMRSGFLLWIFFIPWTAFSTFWIGASSNFKLPNFESPWSFFPLFGLPFLLIGVAGLLSPLWLRRKSHSIIYAISNQRAIAIEGVKSITVKSFPAVEITRTVRVEHSDGSGNLLLGVERGTDANGRPQIRQEGFVAVSDVRRVEKLLQDLVEANAA